MEHEKRLSNGYRKPQTDEEVKRYIECMYEEHGEYSEGYMSVKRDNKWTFIDCDTFEELGIPRYEYASKFNDGLAFVKYPHSREFYFINKLGKEVYRISTNRKTYFDGYVIPNTLYAVVRRIVYGEAKCGIFDLKTKNEIIKPKYDILCTFNKEHEYFYMSSWGSIGNDSITIFDKTGQEIHVLKDFILLGAFTNDYAPFCKKNLTNVKGARKFGWGYVDYLGNMVIGPKYGRADQIDDKGFAYITLDGKLRKINILEEIEKEKNNIFTED